MSEAKEGIMLDKYPVRSDSTAHRTIDGVALVVDAAEGKLRTLNKVGTFIWEQANGKLTLSEIVDLVCQEFDVDYPQAALDAEVFVQDLESKNMLVLANNPAGSE